ncbi:MAG: PAS domain S-box protein, partial [Methylotenera sp.]
MTKQNVKKHPPPAVALNAEHESAQANYRALFEYAPDGILVANSVGCYMDANPSICSMLGYTRDELIGMHATDIVVETEIPYIEPALATIKNKTDYSREWLLRRKDGSVFSADIIATTMPDGNILAMVRDITILKQQQSEISKLTHLHAALTRVNQSIIWLPDKVQLFNTLCHI